MDFLNMDKRFKISKILIRNIIFLLLFARLVTQTISLDSATSCSPNAKQSRRGRAKMLATIPCDLTTQAYCILPGTAYPWHAVRRFVHENQGLMKRMYGDVRHISVLRDEMLNNEIDIDDMELAAERYSRDGYNHRGSKFMHNRDEFDNFKVNDVLRDLHFIPLITPTTTPTTTTTLSSSSESSVSATTTSERVETTVVANDLENPTPDITTVSTKTTIENEQNTEFDTDVKSNSSDALEENETPIKANDFLESQQLIDDIKEERAHVKGDVLIEFNSVYETSGGNSSPSPIELLGDNIEIVESPQLGLVNITLGYAAAPTADVNYEISTTPSATTISTTAEKPTTTSTAATTTTTTAAAAATTTKTTITTTTARPTSTTTPKAEIVAGRLPTKQQRKPFIPSSSYRHRPQQLHKIESTISAKLKLKVHPTPTTPFKTFTSSLSSSDSIRNHTTSSSSTTLTTSLNSTKSSHPLKQNSNKNYNRYTTLNNNRYGLQHTTSPASLLTSSAQPFKGNADLLLGEKLRKPVANSTPTTQASNRPVLREGQLFQDTVKQEPVPITNARGVNACAVKEEVVAPFWANNTRGEVLALLNLYPFEQYVHWEKCTHEHKQMYCREGCRCEQQYRLHRLLAYDPNNECRGIFSDWFRFPSCCICQCYNIPLDFRATSRSPRADHRHPIEVAEEQVKNAIYEHATEDWYRPKDEFDLYDG